MRSRSCTVDGPEDGPIQTTKTHIKLEQDSSEPAKNTVNVPDKDETMEAPKKPKPPGTKRTTKPELSRTDLIHLLGVMEGEVQAREDVIHLLWSDRTGPEALEAHYGSAASLRPLQALHRDRLLGPGHTHNTDDVYQKPMAELDRLEDQQKETYRRMLEQLLLAEKCHRRTVTELDNEKRKHVDFMNKSDDFTNLLEQERERLKRLLEQEKVYQARKDKDHSRRLEKVQAELVKLKSFALMLVEERQLHMEQMDQQSQKVQDLTLKLQEKDQRLVALTGTAKEDARKVLKLEAELENRATKFTKDHEEMSTKLVDQETQSRQLRLKLTGLSQKIEELDEQNKALQKAEEDLQELREKISKGECGNASLMSELENLRKRVLEMEGKDEEITKTETQCKELRKKLQDEENHSKELKLEVEKLQKRMVELEKLEGAFNKSKTECSQLHINLEKEKRVVKDLAMELETVKARLKELESSESKFDRTEMVLKDDLMKLKSFTMMLVEERKKLSERLKQEEQKSEDLRGMFKAEQGKVMEVTEKLIEESKKLLKLKSEMEVKVTTLTQEKDEMKTKLTSEEEKCEELNCKVNGMKLRIDGLEEAEKEMLRTLTNDTRSRKLDDDNKVKELTLEIERLRNRLKHLEVVEGDLMKTEDEYDLLEKKFRTEQDKANALSKMLVDMKDQIARNKAIEKCEVMSPEAELRIRCKMEETKTRELQVDVQALKEKIHELMNKEDQLSQLQVDYSILQQRLIEEESRRSCMGQEMANLTKELEATRRYSRALRPGMNGRRMVDIHVTSTAVQTDAVAEEETTAGFIQKSVLEENHLMNNLRQRVLKKPVLERYPPASADLGAKKTWIPWMKKKEAITLSQTTPENQKPGRPLHIRVMPDHGNSTAKLEITSPQGEDFFSSTTIIPTLGLQKPCITIVPKPTTVTSKTKPHEGSEGLHRAKSPVTITTISRARSPEKSTGNGFQSPVSIITVSTTPVAEACAASESHELASGRTVLKMSPERQPGPSTVRKFNSNSKIITTEDNKIHIHLGSQFNRPAEACSPLVNLRPAETGTVLRSPRQPATPSKMTSSLTITPITSVVSKPTTSTPGSDVHPFGNAAVATAGTRIPVSKGTKAVVGVSTVTRLESRAEGQSMKIELRKSMVCSSASASTGKS